MVQQKASSSFLHLLIIDKKYRGGGTIRQPRLKQRVLYVWESVERVNKLLKIVGKNNFVEIFTEQLFQAVLDCRIF